MGRISENARAKSSAASAACFAPPKLALFGMGKRARRVFTSLVATLLMAALFGGLVWVIVRAPVHMTEPVYRGKPLTYWLGILEPVIIAGPTNLDARMALYPTAVSAVSETGTNAIPYLLQMLRAHDSPVKAWVLMWASRHPILHIHYTDPAQLNLLAVQGFEQLRTNGAVTAVPELIKLLDEKVSEESEADTAFSLGIIGPGAEAAVPSLVPLTASTNERVHGAAIFALAQISSDPDAVVPVFVKDLRDLKSSSWQNSTVGLANFGNRASSAVPALVAWLQDSNVVSNSAKYLPGIDMRAAVGRALRRIDPKVYDHVVTNAVDGSSR